MFTRQVKVQIGEKFFYFIRYKRKMLWWETNTSPSISSLLGRVFAIFCQRTYGPNPMDVDIKVFIPEPTINKILKPYIGIFSIIGK